MNHLVPTWPIDPTQNRLPHMPATPLPPVKSAPVKPAGNVEFIHEFGEPIAAIIPNALKPEQRDSIYAMLPREAVLNLQLSKRWNVWAVLCGPDWASAQLRRVPMLKPKGKLWTVL